MRFNVGEHVRIKTAPGRPLGRVIKLSGDTAKAEKCVYDVWVEAEQREYRDLKGLDLGKPGAR